MAVTTVPTNVVRGQSDKPMLEACRLLLRGCSGYGVGMPGSQCPSGRRTVLGLRSWARRNLAAEELQRSQQKNPRGGGWVLACQGDEGAYLDSLFYDPTVDEVLA